MATFRLQDSTTTSDSNSTLHRIKHEKKDGMYHNLFYNDLFYQPFFF